MMTSSLTPALKEWAIALQALTAGETILLLRKGGIREESGRFTVAHSRVWLFPTYEHQNPDLLKPKYARQVQPVASGWHPETISIQAWADIKHIFQVTDATTVEALLPFHIWTPQFVTERLRWKPRSPLYVLLLRVFRLPAAHTVPYTPEYGGCRSWIELLEPLSVEGSTPVLDDVQYQQEVRAIATLIDTATHPSPA